MYGNAGRNAGVKVPENQFNNKSDKPSLTVTGLMKLEFVAVRYVDARGNERSDLVVKAGDDLYMAPDGNAWVNNMRPLSEGFGEKVAAAITAVLGSGPDGIPTEDNVNVVAEEIAHDERPASAG